MLPKNLIKKSLYLLFSTIALNLSRFVKVSFIVGSYASFFSAINIIAPMAGVFGGISNSFLLLITHSLIKWALLGGSFIPLLGYHIPHFFASFYWNSGSALSKIIVPIVCMVLFIAHPVGNIAFSYALLWLIPIAIALMNKKNIMLKAVGSTFTAHAVGSVIWIYSVPMLPQAWVALIPVALVERLVFASGMVIIYYSYLLARSYFYHGFCLSNFKKVVQ